jgi:pimeloyl-ACP methyl ester carboxylesterase
MPKVIPSRVRPATPWSARRVDEEYGGSAEPSWRRIDWRERLSELEIGGRRVNYVDIGEGEGPPVVFVHGLGGCWQNWLENLPRIAQERRALALDLPGFGRSEMPAGEVSISGYARCVEEFCERLELGPVALVGNSMGGFISAETAIRFPERVERLALVSAAGLTHATLARRPTMTAGRIATALTAYTAAGHRQFAARPGLRHAALLFVARYPSRLRADLVYEGLMRGAASGSGFMEALEALLAYDYRDRLPEIGCPTLIVWGEDDVVAPVEDAHEYERLIPDTRKLVLDDTGHVPMLERPEPFNRCLVEFLAEVDEAREQRSAAA